MAFQSVFKRYELKYKISPLQKEIILAAMAPYMEPDQYGKTTIRNIYFDTDNYRLIRSSVEGPIYKEKLRIRSYKKATQDSTVFVELKKKYNHVVFKRRISLSEKDATEWVCGKRGRPDDSQIAQEIEYFIDFYGALRPCAFISYDREAFYSVDGDGFRITFDENILFRDSALSLTEDAYGTPLLRSNEILMEVKCAGGIPLWLVQVLTKERIFKLPFSKYGTAYKEFIFPHIHKEKFLSKETLINA